MSKINASIEVSAKHVLDGKLHSSMLPKGTRVYITDVGVDPLHDIISASRQVTNMGYKTVPHVPARRIESPSSLEHRLSSLVGEAGVTDILIIAGEADEQMGPYSQALEILQTGLIDKLGIKDIAVGGHPEGNPAYGGKDVMQVLREKIAFSSQSDAEFRIVTQFGFDGPKFIQWIKDVSDAGISAPIHLGVAGPAKITTLIKYAALCGVGNSLSFFKKRTSAITQLATKHSPEDVVSPIESAWMAGTGNLAQIHVFPFGWIWKSPGHLRCFYQGLVMESHSQASLTHMLGHRAVAQQRLHSIRKTDELDFPHQSRSRISAEVSQLPSISYTNSSCSAPYQIASTKHSAICVVLVKSPKKTSPMHFVKFASHC